MILLAAAILTVGRRTIANLLRTLGTLASGHVTSYQRVLSQARWSSAQLACLLVRQVLQLLPATIPVPLVGDDTVESHPGPKVHGKARHRDPVRSTHSYTAWRYGHKWVVLAVLVRFPFATRPWALPVLVALYRSEEDDRRAGGRHLTPAQHMQRLLRLRLLWFPDRAFVFVGDSSYGTHAMARFVARQKRLVLVSKVHPDVGLYEPPPPYNGRGRPRVKGSRLPTPRHAATTGRRRQLTVAWYGGGRRKIEVVTGTGCWYKSGRGIVPIKWVSVRDLDGTHRDEFFYTTDVRMGVRRIVELYTGRWNLETTFQEARSCLGLETTRGWCRATVLRAAPCLFGLYSVVALLYHDLPADQRVGAIGWPGKVGTTFSDALSAVRRRLWSEWIFAQAEETGAIQKLPPPLREFLFSALATAA